MVCLATIGAAGCAESRTVDAAGADLSDFGKPGRYGVGYEQVRASDDLEVHAWYPTSLGDGDTDPEIRYVVRNKMPAIVSEPAIVNVGRASEHAEADRDHGPYPLVVLSPGFALSPTFYSTLVEQYVSRGFVVLGPEHDEEYEPGPGWNWRILFDRPRDISRTIDLAEELRASDGVLEDLIDISRVAVVGHSFGGYTALAVGGARFDLAPHLRRCAALAPDDPRLHFCEPFTGHEREMAERAGLADVPTGLWPSMRDPRVTSIISMAGDAYMFDAAGLASLTIPVMSMGGTADIGTPYDWGAELTFEHSASSVRSLVAFEGADHMIFGAPCDRLPWVAATAYGTAGFCGDPVWDKDEAHRLIHQYSTAFLTATLLCDPEAGNALAPTAIETPGLVYDTSAVAVDSRCAR